MAGKGNGDGAMAGKGSRGTARADMFRQIMLTSEAAAAEESRGSRLKKRAANC